MRVPLILALAVLALVIGGLWLGPSKKLPAAPASQQTTRHWMDGYRVGHDWVEPPSDTEGRHPLLAGDWQSKAEFQCTQPECRTCQWMRMFGGEW